MISHEVCRKLGITRMTLHNYVKKGLIKIKTKYSPRLIIYDDDSVNRLYNEGIQGRTKYDNVTVE